MGKQGNDLVVEPKSYKRKGSLFTNKMNEEPDVVMGTEETNGRVKNLRNFYENQLKEVTQKKAGQEHVKGQRRRRSEKTNIFNRKHNLVKKESSKLKGEKFELEGKGQTFIETPLAILDREKKERRKIVSLTHCSIL